MMAGHPVAVQIDRGDRRVTVFDGLLHREAVDVTLADLSQQYSKVSV